MHKMPRKKENLTYFSISSNYAILQLTPDAVFWNYDYICDNDKIQTMPGKSKRNTESTVRGR